MRPTNRPTKTEGTKTMNLRAYNQAEIAQMQGIRDRLKWLLGEEMGKDPSADPKALQELESRFANWLLDEHGGEELRKSTLKQNNETVN